MPFDHITDTGAFVACTYVVDVRGIHTEEQARLLLSQARDRVAHGRRLKPTAAHYVDVVAAGTIDDGVRNGLLAELGHGDGIDGVAIQGLSHDGGPSFNDRWATTWRKQDVTAKQMGPGWATVAQAAKSDALLEGTIIAADENMLRVAVDGAVGTLPRELHPPTANIGDKIRVRVVVLNLKQKRLMFAPFVK
jgi:hypothetical protein